MISLPALVSSRSSIIDTFNPDNAFTSSSSRLHDKLTKITSNALACSEQLQWSKIMMHEIPHVDRLRYKCTRVDQ